MIRRPLRGYALFFWLLTRRLKAGGKKTFAPAGRVGVKTPKQIVGFLLTYLDHQKPTAPNADNRCGRPGQRSAPSIPWKFPTVSSRGAVRAIVAL